MIFINYSIQQYVINSALDYMHLTVGRWFSPGTSVSTTYKTDLHDITEILLKEALYT